MDYIIGTIIQYGSDTIPEGWLLCDGSAVSRTTYADLYAVIGTTFGAGNGSTTFNVPNLKGRVGVGKDSTQTEFDALGENGGAKTHTLTTNEIPSMIAQGATQTTGGNMVWFKNDAVGGTQGSGSGSTLANIEGGGQAHNILQPYLVTNYIIKALKVTPEGTKISDLRELSSLDDSDIIPIVDVSADETMKITKSNLQNSLLVKQTYSTTEQVVGTWIDGKPIYRKVVTFSRNDSSQFTISFSGVDKFIKIDGTAYGNTGLKHILYHVSDADQFRCYIQDNNDLTILVGSTHPRAPFTGYVIVEYTKTSDTV